MRFFLIISTLWFLNNSIIYAQVKHQPIFIKADFVEYDALADYIYASSNIQIMTDQHLITSDKVIYDIEKDILIAQDRVKVVDKQNQVIYGQTVYFQDELKKGIIKNFIVKFPDNSLLASKLATRLDENRSNLCNTSFTPCKVDEGRKPIWQISAQNTDIDLAKQKVIYNHVFFKVYGVPIFYTPYFAHPLPNADAQSGILVPKIQKSDLTLPIYFRLKNNIDTTITPRISKNYIIYEGEFRHKTDNGYYSLNGSYGKVPYALKNDQGALIKKTRVNGFHLFARGNFNQNDYNYGFDVAKTSDKAYLKNYYNLHNSYLFSKLYLNNIEDYNYIQLESLYFQGLRTEDNEGNSPLILPKLKTKNVFNLNDEESLQFIVNNNTLFYREPSGIQLGRESLALSIANQYIANQGYLFDLKGSFRNELYFINQLPNSNKNNNNYINKKDYSNKQFVKTIPELEASWRYPLIGTSGDLNFSLEPIIVTNIGLNFKNNYNKFALIDAGRFELSDDNLFKSNHFSGIDYHEYGQRIAYGVNSGLLLDKKFITLSIGQLHYKNNNIAANGTGEIVGRMAMDFDNNFGLFYRFRKNKEYEPIRDELGFSYFDDKIRFNSSYIKLQNLTRYYSNNNLFKFNRDRIKQAYYNFEYRLTPNLMIGNELGIDLTNKRTPLLYRTIKMTYIYDCVSISTKFYNDYTSDSTRGIKKTSTKTISIGLKVLNM